MRKRLIAAAIAVGIVVAGYFGYDYYFNQKPVDLADEYRAEVRGATEAATSSMYATFVSFDRYLSESLIPTEELENVDDIDEYRRRVVPVINDADDALEDAGRKIKAARGALKRAGEKLRDTPTARFLEDSEPISETEAVARTSKDYIARAERFLRSYATFVEYSRDDLDLRLREIEIFSQNEVEPSASLEEVEASVAAELEETQALRKAREQLEPHPDAEKLYEQSVEYTNVNLDYLEQTDAALDALDVAALDAAFAELLEETKSLGRKDTGLFSKLSRSSGLTDATKSLTDRGDELENAIASLGEGGKRDGERREPPITPIPVPPKDGGGDGGGDNPDESIS